MASTVETLIRGAMTKGILKVAAVSRNRMQPPTEPHTFLTGIHTPMAQELTLTSLAVTGTIPAELDGSFLRNGPNPVTPPNPASYHWFTGTGMLHGVRLKEGKALWYRNRWVRGTEVSRALGEPVAPGPRGPFDTPNTNVVDIAGATWAIVEAGGNPVRLDEDLNTLAHDPFGGTLKGGFTAHPHRDPDTGDYHAICYEGTDSTTIRHVVINSFGKVRREEPIRVQDGPSIHDCMITKNYVIILDLPVTFSMKTLLAGHQFPYKWNPEHKARVGLLPKEGKETDIIWCDVAPCYVFHPCNAFENEDGTISLDVCAHDSMFAESTIGPDSKTLAFERWTIDPLAYTVTRCVIDSQPQEFPRPNEAFIGKPYRFAYAVPLRMENGDFSAESHLIKHDLATGTRQLHEFGAGKVPGEFVFVPKAGCVAEDDGWMMGYVIDTANETTDLVILDAANFAGEAQATITIPHRIPPGFHGNWIAAQ